MTRINTVPPSELTGPHLVAEYREAPRVFALVRAAAARGERPGDKRNPTAYTLGKGHVRFFYSRLAYLADRQAALVAEMLRRGYKPAFTDCLRSVNADIPREWWGEWVPDADALAVNRARIAERIGKNVAG